MDKLKHTPGPWKITKYTETTISDDNDRTIASAGSYNDGTESTYLENKANAKLITAAPEMLEALIEIRKWYEETGFNKLAPSTPVCFSTALSLINKITK